MRTQASNLFKKEFEKGTTVIGISSYQKHISEYIRVKNVDVNSSNKLL